ncbi:MAG TPA: DUF433 domain-containing protein [Blastocatellia bacterium]|nr:DUF433 domain-containing protein [Blastocatellia bacterium]
MEETIEHRDGAYRIAGTRVSLDSIVYAFNEGLSPETIAREYFPVLSTEQVNRAIAYYLAHRDEIDRYLERGKQEYDALREASHEADQDFYRKLTNARQPSRS